MLVYEETPHPNVNPCFPGMDLQYRVYLTAGHGHWMDGWLVDRRKNGWMKDSSMDGWMDG